MKRINGKITITRTSNHLIEIMIIDDEAGVKAFEIKVAYEEFAKALTNLAEQPCLVEFNDSGKVGKKREVKTEVCRGLVYNSGNVFNFVSHEVHGWIPDMESANDWRNIIRYLDTDGLEVEGWTEAKYVEAKVTFRRWV